MELYVKELENLDKPIIVFLHGGGVSGWMWDKQADFFKDNHIIIPDLPSHGKSSNIHFESIKKTAEEITNIIEARAKGKGVNLIGFSLGAQIAVEILSMKPEIIESAIICSALVRPMKFGKKLIDPTIKMSFSLISNRFFQKIQSRALYISEENFETYYNEVKQTSLDDLIAYLNANMSYRLPDVFKEHKVRTLVLVGSKEKSIMLKSSMDIVKCNKNCEGYIIPHMGHGVSLAKPDLFNKIVEVWLKGEKFTDEIKPLNEVIKSAQ